MPSILHHLKLVSLATIFSVLLLFVLVRLLVRACVLSLSFAAVVLLFVLMHLSIGSWVLPLGFVAVHQLGSPYFLLHRCSVL